MTGIFKALGDDNRLRILNLLSLEELCVCEIEVMLDLTQSNVSRHLAKLRSAGVINSYKDGQWMHYKISDDFKNEHALLVDYLMQMFGQIPVYDQDKNRYEAYDKSTFTCQTIRADRESVMSYLEAVK